VVVFALLTGAAFQSLFWALFTGAVLLVSTSGYWFPTRYRLDEEGASLQRLGGRRFRRWAELRRLDQAGGSWRLCTLPKPSRLDRIRGVELRDPPPNAQDMVLQRMHAA
jgi:hypothetical protein